MHSRSPYDWETRKAVLELDFEESEFESRINRIQKAMIEDGLDVLLVWDEATRGSNVRYLTGFFMAPTGIGSSLVILERDGAPRLVTNSIAHGEPMHSNIQTAWVRDIEAVDLGFENLLEPVRQMSRAWRPGCFIGVTDFERMPYSLRLGIEDILYGRILRDDGGLMKRQRSIKSAAEINLLRKLGKITTAGMMEAMSAVISGATESDVAAAAHHGCMAAGAEQMTFGCFVGAGKRGALKNMAPRKDRIIASNEMVVIDLGCKFGGYQSDMSRNVVAGRPTDAIAEMIEACQAALAAGKSTIKPGIADQDVIRAMRASIGSAGFGQWDWSICHGYGLDLVETPTFAESDPTTIEAGMCFYVEPMIIPPDIGSVCIEDMIVVTSEGFENLTPVTVQAWR